ncbi:hypothetical protein D9758_007547 [Tetrapyrgos nigripes]|uniref:Uncharacterized protein n=1 Tax=Tetrapyrgos nigripes TaxID=182062 RepID=A0A8H5G877_9AGAR|nr:hypothetical protein D9758_007547 [Tetrapyrgos nigripes]
MVVTELEAAGLAQAEFAARVGEPELVLESAPDNTSKAFRPKADLPTVTTGREICTVRLSLVVLTSNSTVNTYYLEDHPNFAFITPNSQHHPDLAEARG